MSLLGLTSYAFELSSKTWSQFPMTLTPDTARAEFAMVYDDAQDRVVAFGGLGQTAVPLAETWLFDGTTWSPHATTEQPAPTLRAGADWDPVREALIVFDSAGVTWQFKDGTWTRLFDASDTTPPGRQHAGMSYQPYRKRFLLAGGLDEAGAILDDVWELDPDALEWSQVFVSGIGALPRFDFVFEMHPQARAIVLYGGAEGSRISQGDTWSLKYMSPTPDENCTDGADTDGDAQMDDEDPDCDPPP